MASGRWIAVWWLTSTLAACGTAPPAVPPPQPPPVPTPVETAVREPTCPSCAGPAPHEVARLRQDLAQREAELRDLRSKEREQLKVLQKSTREVTRARMKLRRLATQADAASFVAEVEVAMEALRSSVGATSTDPLLVLAQGILASTDAPFAQGDYGGAMDRAAQAEQLIAVVAHYHVRPGSRPRVPGEVPFQTAIPLKVAGDSNLRRQPSVKAPIVGMLKRDSALVAHAYKGRWMQVQTADGRSGWVHQTRLGAR